MSPQLQILFEGSDIIPRHDSLYDGDGYVIIGCHQRTSTQTMRMTWYRANTTTELQDGSKYSIDTQQGTLTIRNAGNSEFTSYMTDTVKEFQRGSSFKTVFPNATIQIITSRISVHGRFT